MGCGCNEASFVQQTAGLNVAVSKGMFHSCVPDCAFGTSMKQNGKEANLENGDLARYPNPADGKNKQDLVEVGRRRVWREQWVKEGEWRSWRGIWNVRMSLLLLFARILSSR